MNGGLSDDIQQYIPNTCSNSPSSGQAFCKPLCEAVSAMGKFNSRNSKLTLKTM